VIEMLAASFSRSRENIGKNMKKSWLLYEITNRDFSR
jgi:hypothetical protein